MKKVVKLKVIEQKNKATLIWMHHLINRLLLEELDLPTPIKAKVVYQTVKAKKEEST